MNNALGTTIGGLLNGRKTGLGALGLLATAILPAFFPQLAPLGSVISAIGGIAEPVVVQETAQVAAPGVVQPAAETVAKGADMGTRIMAALQPIFLALTGWGVLGKMDKWSNKQNR